MYGGFGGGYTTSATGFGADLGFAASGTGDVAALYGSTTGNHALYTDMAIAQLYGNNVEEEASGFPVVDAIGGPDVNTKASGTASFQLNYIGDWTGG
jgi:hypothetical protein